MFVIKSKPGDGKYMPGNAVEFSAVSDDGKCSINFEPICSKIAIRMLPDEIARATVEIYPGKILCEGIETNLISMPDGEKIKRAIFECDNGTRYTLSVPDGKIEVDTIPEPVAE